MCTYCEELFTGNCNESLLESRISMFNNTPMIDVDVFINDNELEVYVDCIHTGEPIVKSKIKIKYCPMCGTRLKEES